MADIKYQYYSLKYCLTTYENVLCTYEWIKDCFEYVFADITSLEISVRIDFEHRNTRYECKSIDEFKRYAFGKEVIVESLFISASDASTILSSLAYVYAGCSDDKKGQSFSITSNDELVIANIKEALDREKRKQHSEHITINKYENNCVNIGDNTVIQNSNINNENNIEVNGASKKNELSGQKWYEKITWDIVVPIIVGIIIVAICTWLGLD